MTKALSKYVLTLIILLLNGYDPMHARSSQDWLPETPKRFLQIPAQNTFDQKQNASGNYIKCAVLGTQENDKIYSEENREETFKLNALKPFVHTGSFFTSFFPKISGDFFYGIQKCLRVSTHWFHCSSSRYIVLRVFRI